jgi:hypothetical protein
MGRLISVVFGKKNDVRGVRQDRNVVLAAAQPTHLMRLEETARSLLARLAWCVGASTATYEPCLARTASGAAAVLEHPCSSRSWQRRGRLHGLRCRSGGRS